MGPRGTKLITEASEHLSLNDVEYCVLRPIWCDPGIDYLVICASIGCPNVPTDAFTAANMEAVLAAALRRTSHFLAARQAGGVAD